MKVLWLVVLGLALLYVGIWAAGKQMKPPAPPAVNAPGVPAADSQALVDLAKGDAISRVDPRARFEIVSVVPKMVMGADLRDASLGQPGAQPGFMIVLAALVDNKEVSRLTYHAAPPNTVVFVKQEAK